MSTPVTVLVVDDHAGFRDGLAAELAADPGVDVVATAADGAEAVRAAMRHRPEVVVMDLHMPRMNGVEATRRLRADLPGTKVLALTSGEHDGSVLAAIRAGASGSLAKDAGRHEVVRAISTVRGGGHVLDAELVLRIAELLCWGGGAAAPLPLQVLTAREVEILDLVAAGRSNAQIAAALLLAPKTVRNNVSTILTKLAATNRADAISRARDAGLGGWATPLSA